jgi:hypothetical protein
LFSDNWKGRGDSPPFQNHRKNSRSGEKLKQQIPTPGCGHCGFALTFDVSNE